ncbi:MAG TPA: acyltransferase [Chitinophagaceae bacterium]|nr:acyltransferase [Chitinophagaceae bacterium]
MAYDAHPTAIVEPGSIIGEGVRIWHFSHIMPGSIIGDNCIIGQNVFVGTGVVLGRNVKVQNNVSIYDGVVCEDDVFLGPSMVFTNIKNPRSLISRKHAFQQTMVRRGATIGANATILCGLEIGSFAFVGAGAVVTKPVAAHSLVIGNPARHSGWMSEYGHRLHFDENRRAWCPESEEEYELQKESVRKLTTANK